MDKNISVIIQYDGTRYKGWQKQGNTKETIQGKLENILHTITLFFTKFVYHHTTPPGFQQVVHCMKSIHIFLSALWESALVFWG